MELKVSIVKEDLKTVIHHGENILINESLYQLQRVARYMRCNLIGTVSIKGYTIINEPQLYILASEIQRLKNCADIDQVLLNKFQLIVDAVKPYSCQYIKFMGE